MWEEINVIILCKVKAWRKGENMGCLGNLLWFLLGGCLGGIAWCLAGCLLCITIIGIPVGMQ